MFENMIIPIAIGVVVFLIVIVLIAMAVSKNKKKKVVSNNNIPPQPVVKVMPNNVSQKRLQEAPVEQKVVTNAPVKQINTQTVVKQTVVQPVKHEVVSEQPEVNTVVNEAENVLDDIKNIIGDHQVTTEPEKQESMGLDEKGRPKRIVENTKIDIDLTDEKAKEDVILKLKTPSNKKTPYKVKPPVVKDTPGEKAEVTINEAMDEPDEPKYDKIPDYVDPRTIKENGVDAEVTEGVALEENKASEIDVFDDTHKEEKLPLTNEQGEYVEEVKSTPLHEEYEYDPEDDEIEETKEEVKEEVKEETKPQTNYEVDENYSKTEILDVSEIDAAMERRRRIAEITEEEIFKYIAEMQDSLIDEAENYIEEMKSKAR